MPAILLVGATGWHADAAVPPSPATNACTGSGFALYRHGRSTVVGCPQERELLAGAHHDGDADTFAFLRDGLLYAVTNADLLSEVDEALAEQHETDRAVAEQRRELAHQQAELGRRQAEYARRQQELGHRIDDVTKQYTKDWERRMHDAAASADRSDEAASESAALKVELEDVTSGLRDQIAALGEEMNQLGEEQGQLGSAQAGAGSPSPTDSTGVIRVMDRAIGSGAAHLLEPTQRVWRHPLA